MDRSSFAVTWDYRCPFARNAHEHLVAGLLDGAPWQVTFEPFSLSQTHVEEGELAVWDDPSKTRDLQSMLAAIVVRDRYPEQFLGLHQLLFSARHDLSRDLRDPGVLAELLEQAGLPADKVVGEIEDGWPLAEFRSTHERLVGEHSVWGVPTFIMGERAVFVRLMNRPQGDAMRARETIDEIIQLIERRPEINEFKYTSLSA